MDNIYKFLLFGGMIGPYTMSIELLLEMRELKSNGYTMDEILKLIEEYFPLKDFKSDESDFLKKDAIKNLKIIYRKERND